MCKQNVSRHIHYLVMHLFIDFKVLSLKSREINVAIIFIDTNNKIEKKLTINTYLQRGTIV